MGRSRKQNPAHLLQAADGGAHALAVLPSKLVVRRALAALYPRLNPLHVGASEDTTTVLNQMTAAEDELRLHLCCRT